MSLVLLRGKADSAHNNPCFMTAPSEFTTFEFPISNYFNFQILLEVVVIQRKNCRDGSIIWFAAVGSLHVEVRFWKMWFCSIFSPWRVNILGGLQSKKVVSKIGLIKIIHLNKFFSLYFTQILMVSNIGIEIDNEMSKLRPPVYMELCGFGQIKPF